MLDFLHDPFALASPAHLTSPHLTSPHLTSPHLTSPHLTSPHLTSPHLTSPHLTSPHLTSPHLTSPHLTSPHLTHLTSPHLTSPHLTSPHLTSPHLTSPHLTSPHLTSPHLTSPHLTSPHLTSPHLTSPHLTSPHLTSSPHLCRRVRSNLGRGPGRCPRGWHPSLRPWQTWTMQARSCAASSVCAGIVTSSGDAPSHAPCSQVSGFVLGLEGCAFFSYNRRTSITESAVVPKWLDPGAFTDRLQL